MAGTLPGPLTHSYAHLLDEAYLRPASISFVGPLSLGGDLEVALAKHLWLFRFQGQERVLAWKWRAGTCDLLHFCGPEGRLVAGHGAWGEDEEALCGEVSLPRGRAVEAWVGGRFGALEAVLWGERFGEVLRRMRPLAPKLEGTPLQLTWKRVWGTSLDLL